MADRQGILYREGTSYDRTNLQEGSRRYKRGTYTSRISTFQNRSN